MKADGWVCRVRTDREVVGDPDELMEDGMGKRRVFVSFSQET